MNQGRGLFITLEGLDGAGKTTQAFRLLDTIKASGQKAIYVKEPTNGHWGQKIKAISTSGNKRPDPLEELDLFLQDRTEDVVKNIAPALETGQTVIADRYIASNIAYQAALNLNPSIILEANQKFPWPDLIILLEIEVSSGLKRIRESRHQSPDPIFEKEDYLAKVKKQFDALDVPGLVRLPAQRDPDLLASEIENLYNQLLCTSPLPKDLTWKS